MRVMAIDYGDARTGVAISDLLGTLVGRTAVIHSRNREKTAAEIKKLLEESGADHIVDTAEELEKLPEGVTVIRVEDTRYALAFLSAAWFGHPAEKLKTIGITGTKGKTTTTYLVKSILEHAGFQVGLVGTIETIIGEKHIPATNTTPESYCLQESFAEMVPSVQTSIVSLS